LDNKVFDIIDARCNHEVRLILFTFRKSTTLLHRSYVKIPI